MQGDNIKIVDRKLVVGDSPIIPFIEGDGIGIDIWPASKNVIDSAVEKAYRGTKKIIWKEYLQFSVFRGNINRDEWSKKWEKNIYRGLIKRPLKINPIDFDAGEIPDEKIFSFKKDECKGRLKGGRKKGLERMEYFFKEK